MCTCSFEGCLITEGKFIKGLCSMHYHKKNYSENRTSHLAVSQAWAEANKEKRCIASRKYYAANPDKLLDPYYKRIYGISYENYCSLLTEQNNVCAICHKEETNTYKGKIKRLAVDHNHETGAIRGLLCTKCNVRLGHSDDSIDILQSSIDYLKKHSE